LPINRRALVMPGKAARITITERQHDILGLQLRIVGPGVIELTMLVLYLVPKTRYLGGLVMLAYLGGAVATHVHSSDGMFFVPLIVGVVAWLGLYLRDRKLRALVPLVAE
jgi:hypothetical protein